MNLKWPAEYLGENSRLLWRFKILINSNYKTIRVNAKKIQNSYEIVRILMNSHREFEIYSCTDI
jgi:hypothetical protein